MISRLYDWLDERTGIKERVRQKKGQAVPGHVYFYCFGGASFFIILVQLVTGLFMLWFYVPEPEEALKSIEYMSNEVPGGALARNMHRWGSTLLIATIFTHVASVIYMKAYRRPRELNWLSGVLQFIVVFVMLVTGVLLPWDWRAYWSFSIWVDYFDTWPVIGQWMKDFVLDSFTINRGFVTHVMILPVFLFGLLYFHFKMVRKHGISEPL